VGDSVSSWNEALGSLLALDGKSSARVSRSGLLGMSFAKVSPDMI
jgi:hypothetical protein